MIKIILTLFLYTLRQTSRFEVDHNNFVYGNCNGTVTSKM